MAKPQCSVCGSEREPEDLTHLMLYCNGSEGIWVCLDCRMVLTNVATGMRHACGKARLDVYRREKKRFHGQED